MDQLFNREYADWYLANTGREPKWIPSRIDPERGKLYYRNPAVELIDEYYSAALHTEDE